MEARRLIDSMVCVGLRPNVISYNTLIHGHCLTGRVDKAAKLLDNMFSGSQLA
jgi:leucine-rich PPR motif-containing protein